MESSMNFDINQTLHVTLVVVTLHRLYHTDVFTPLMKDYLSG